MRRRRDQSPSWLVTGGAGYIGSHVLRSMVHRGHRVVALDDLSTGRPDRVRGLLVEGSVHDAALLRDTMTRHHVTGVIHLAAKKDVAESCAEPLRYYRENVGGMVSLLAAMAETGVTELVFSSSAAVYGMTDSGLVDEAAPTRPMNPYGETKLAGEWLAAAQARVTPLRAVMLRYFNVAGASAPELGESASTSLIPRVLRAVRDGRPATIFGDDYDTPDGTCVRDYIHVADLADAHTAAIAALPMLDGAQTFNVGCGAGFSVREVIDVAAEVTQHRLDWVVAPRRPGDPASVVASPERIRAVTGWRHRYDLRRMVEDSWRASGHSGERG